MTPSELRRRRQMLDMSLAEFAKALGYSGRTETTVRRIKRMESGSMAIPAATARRIEETVRTVNLLRRSQ